MADIIWGTGGTITNPLDLNVDQIVNRRVICPACEDKIFKMWPEGWDAHAAARCKGVRGVSAAERKADFKARFGHLFRAGKTPPSQLAEIAEQLDRLSTGRPIGLLQDIRKRLKGHDRRVSGQIFGRQTVFENWAFHLGGRLELQFNIGFETHDDQAVLRYGVAFSLEPSRTLPDVDALVPKIARFNEYLRVYPDQFADLRMWHFVSGARSDDYAPSPIPPERCAPHTFIVLGHYHGRTKIDLNVVLETFDRLLPLYEFVEGSGSMFPVVTKESEGLQFKAGCRTKKVRTIATTAQEVLDVALRHNELEQALFDILAKKYGIDKVGTELSTGSGTRADVAVQHSERDVWLYEIKTELSARACVRSALAQLVEYSLWPGSTRASRLIVVGEPVLDRMTEGFLEVLRRECSLPIYYSQLNRSAGTLA